jgi:Mrp family chromosome partitioning ATPase
VDRPTDLFATADSQRLWTGIAMAQPDRLVIIDAPPVLATTDAVVLAKYADEIVFVVEANSTPESAVAAAIDELIDVNPNVSIMLNRCQIGAGGAHYGSYEYYDRADSGEKPETKKASSKD